MSKPAFQGPLLGIKTHRGSPDNWLSKGLGSTSQVLTLAMQGDKPYFPNTAVNPNWEHFGKGHLGIDAPDASFDAVYMTNVLDRYDPAGQKKLVAEAARVTKNNGRVVVYSPACDDAEEIRELALQHAIDTKVFDSRRLSNKDIARLKPHDAMFFLGKIVIPNRKRLVKVLQDMGLPATLEHMWEVNTRFAIRRFHIGMSWVVQRS